MSKRWIWGPLQNPVGANMGPKLDQVAPKVFQNLDGGPPLTAKTLWRPHFFRPDFLMLSGRPLARFWYPFGIVLVPTGSLWQDFQ